MSEVSASLTGGSAKLCLPAHFQKPRLRRPIASAYLSTVWGIEIAPATLAKKACVGGGPRFDKVGRVPYYPTVELDAWATAQLGELRSSTSDRGA